MAKNINLQFLLKIKPTLPSHWNKWGYRKVIRVSDPIAWYKKGEIIKVKYFSTFGCYDDKNRWVNYYDVGPELKHVWLHKLLYFISKWF